jgi:hypothetical protein
MFGKVCCLLFSVCGLDVCGLGRLEGLHVCKVCTFGDKNRIIQESNNTKQQTTNNMKVYRQK